MLDVTLPEPIRAFVEESVRSGRYSSPTEVLCAGLKRLQEREDERARKVAELEAELLKGMDSLERFGSRPFDDTAVEEIKAEGRRRLAAQPDA